MIEVDGEIPDFPRTIDYPNAGTEPAHGPRQHLYPQKPHIVRAIYTYEMPALCWQLLWWMICRMDEKQELRFTWRSAAARDINRDRQWLGNCAKILHRHKLIETAPRKRYAKVLVNNIVG